MGKSWIDKNLQNIVNDGFTFMIQGRKQLFPAHVIRYVAYHTNTNPKPYILDYLQNNVLSEARGHGINFSKYDYEKAT